MANFDFGECKGKLETSSGSIKVTGKVKLPGATKINYSAPASPDYLTSYSGAGLPYATKAMAYENTNNQGVVDIGLDGSFAFSIKYPNAYYRQLGTFYQNPEITLNIERIDGSSKTYLVKIGYGAPFRSLNYESSRTSPLFYDGRELLEIQTQENLLRDSGYPETNQMPDNFWGKSIPN